jgi:hypothetical protein
MSEWLAEAIDQHDKGHYPAAVSAALIGWLEWVLGEQQPEEDEDAQTGPVLRQADYTEHLIWNSNE